MGMSKLNIWVRDTAHPCLPYQSTMHTWIAGVYTCDLQPVWAGLLTEPWSPPVPAGAAKNVYRVHQQVEVPPGCYIVVAAAPCKNVLTDLAMVQVCCNEEACVNLIPKSVSTCAGFLKVALDTAQLWGKYYSPGCPAERQIPKEVLSKAAASLEELRKYLPEDTITPKLGLIMEHLEKLSRDELKKTAEK